MKPCMLRPQAAQDRRDEVRFYRKEAGANVALKRVAALEEALRGLAADPVIGSPTMGQTLALTGMRTWRTEGFPLSFWYFERDAHLDIARLVGHRQDADAIDV